MKRRRILNTLPLIILLLFLFGCKKNSHNSEEANSEVEEETPIVGENVNYELSSEIFPNPERGFARTMNVYAEESSISVSRLTPLRAQNVTMVIRVFYLNLFKDKELSNKQLNLIADDFAKFRNNGLKIIPRLAYTSTNGDTDAPLAIVEKHLQQLQPVLEANKDIIAFMQAGFIGPWGEWHGSTNNLDTKSVLTKILQYVPKEIMVQIRRPRFKQEIFNDNFPLTLQKAYTGENIARVGHHNDCFLAGGTDYGTYTSNNMFNEKQYISNDALYVPVGGETCPPNTAFEPTCDASHAEMKWLRWTYLNLDYYKGTLDGWKNSGCYELFERVLGYRLALTHSIIPKEIESNATLKFRIGIENVGFAPIYNKKITSIILKNKNTGEFSEVPLQFDIRSVKPDSKMNIDESISLSNIPKGDYELFFKIHDHYSSLKNKVEYAIRLANTGVWTTENQGMNKLNQSLTIK